MARRKRLHCAVGELECRALLSGITYSLTTDQSTYQVGQPIQFTFTETNTGDQPATVSVSPTDLTVAAPAGNGWTPIWDSNPQNVGQPPASVTLQPGQSLSQTATWNGTIMETAGVQGASESEAVNQFGKFEVANPNAPDWDTWTFQIANPLQGSLTTDRSTYTVGQPVQLTYTETNTSGQAITILTANPLYQILHDGQPVLPVMDPLPPTFETIASGQTIMNQYTWNGDTVVGSSSPPLTGQFVAELYDVPAPPGQFTADFQIVPSSSTLSYSLTTDQSTYQVGQPIQFTFTETNTGDQPVLVDVRPTDFTVADGTGAIWQSDPSAAGQPATPEELQPGQSITQTATWDGTTPYSLPSINSDPLTYAINHFGTFLVSNLNAPAGTSATFQITNPITIQLTTGRPVYQMGQTVTVTYTETNTSDQSITLMGGQTASALTFWHDGENVTPVEYPQVILLNPTTLGANQTITWSQTWNGIPEYGPYDPANLTGTFFAAYGPENNPTEYTTELQITAPSSWDIASSVTMDQPSYLPGEPVNMTFTETNEGSQPVPVVVGHRDFEVSQDGTLVWNSAGAGTGLSWSLLAPGQSVIETDTWAQVTNSGQSVGGGPFVITNLLDPNSSSASIFIPITDPLPPGTGTTTNDPPASDPGTAAPGSSSEVPAMPLISSAVSTDKVAYKLGQGVRITMSIKDGGTTQAALSVAKGRELITIMQGSTVVWKVARRVRTAKLKSIAPGQTVKLTTIWNGRPNQPGIPSQKPGDYTIDVAYGDYSGSTTIAIGRKG